MDISVIVPSYNAQACLPATLAALRDQCFGGSFEVIVVDCSDSGAVELLCQDFDRVRYHRHGQRFSPGIGRNVGAGLAQGELLCFVDADVRLAADALASAWAFYRAGHRIFGGALAIDSRSGPDAAAYLEYYFFQHEALPGGVQSRRKNLGSALLLVEGCLFLESGGFRDIPRLQDTELTERLAAAGHELWFSPTVRGWAQFDSSMRQVLGKVRINGRNLYFVRYQSLSEARKLLFCLLLPLMTGFKVLRIIGRHLHYQDGAGRLRLIWLSPLLAWAGLYWMAGLYRSALFGGQISRRRE